MQKQTSVYIPKPCHEDWNKMTPTQQGKFCGACNKQVVDFSLMSDNQILNFLSNQSGKLCGRFDAEQLQRPLIETKMAKTKSWWMALTMPLLFLFDRSEAQNVTYIIKTAVHNYKSKELVGAIAIIKKNILIKGKVVDENNNPLAYASVIQKGTINRTNTDSLGNFSLELRSLDSLILIASYVGYSSTEKNIELQGENFSNVIITLPAYVSKGLVDVVVTTNSLNRMAGGLMICNKITRRQKVNTSFKTFIGVSNVYPNPAIKGSSIHIKIKDVGNYQMQLLDNQSRLMQTEEINVDAKNTTTQIQLQSNVAAGMYYLRLINEKTKKQYTEKLIIQ